MDYQTKLIVLSAVAGMAVAGVAVFLWSSIRAIKSASRRKFGSRSSERQPESTGCNCPPYQSSYCVPARIHVPDPTPVAIYGVRPGNGCGCSDSSGGQLSQADVQQIVDRANRLRTVQQERALDDLLANLRMPSGQSGSE